MFPLISIIVPVYKVEPYLRKCVDSILAQTYSNIEVILVDDGSPDNCPAICDEYAEKDSRVTVIHQQNAGVSAARNAGLDAAKGDFIGFVDSDDWIEPDLFDVLYQVITASKSEISVAGFSRDDDIPESVDIGVYDTLSKMEAIKKFLSDPNAGYVTSALFDAKLFSNVRFPIGITISEDAVLLIKLIKNSNNVAYIDYKGYHYYSNPNSAIHIFKDSYWSIQKSGDMIVKEVKSVSDAIVDYAKTRSIQSDISLAILAVDNGKLTSDAYRKIISHIEQYKSGKVLLPFNYKCWCKLFSLGRVPFIAARKALVLLRRVFSMAGKA